MTQGDLVCAGGACDASLLLHTHREDGKVELLAYDMHGLDPEHGGVA